MQDDQIEDMLWGSRQEIRSHLDIHCLEVWDMLPVVEWDRWAVHVHRRDTIAADVAEEFMKQVYTFDEQAAHLVTVLGIIAVGVVVLAGAVAAWLMF